MTNNDCTQRRARFHVKKMAQDRGATFIEGHVVLVDPVRRALVLGSGAEVRYDAVSFNTGSGVRSRAAAATLSEAGFPQVHSMRGGIEAWNGRVAGGAYEAGLAYFSREEQKHLERMTSLLDR